MSQILCSGKCVTGPPRGAYPYFILALNIVSTGTSLTITWLEHCLGEERSQLILASLVVTSVLGLFMTISQIYAQFADPGVWFYLDESYDQLFGD